MLAVVTCSRPQVGLPLVKLIGRASEFPKFIASFCKTQKGIEGLVSFGPWSRGKLDELRHDIQMKTQALSVDELCLRTTSRSLETVADRNAYVARSGTPTNRNLPPSSHARRRTQGAQAARHEVSAHESARNEVLRQQEALRLNQSVPWISR